MSTDLNRRDFVKSAAVSSVAIGALGRTSPTNAATTRANDRINLGVIGIGGRGRSLVRWAMQTGEKPETPATIVGVCDVYARRRNQAKQMANCDFATGDYREILDRKDIDAVIIATPDHWHAPIAIEAMKKGKDVYLEKPMTHTIEEAKQVHETVLKTGKVLQVGSQTTSSDQWWKARKAIQDGLIGQLLMSQGSYHRNSVGGEWNYTIDPKAGPDATGDDHIDWKTWLGSAPARPFDGERFFRFRKYWDYSGGIATDLFYHVMAPLNICWGEAQFPYRVSGTGGIYVYKDGREVPDTFMLTADYPKGHSVVLSSSMANDTHIPGLIRGHEGTIVMVEHGQFEGETPNITVKRQRAFKDKHTDMFTNGEQLVIPVEQREDHMTNWLRCVKTREKPVLDSLTAMKAMVTIALSVQSYREGRTLYFDEKTMKVSRDPMKMVEAVSRR